MNKTSLDKKQFRSWCIAALVFWCALVAGSLYLFGKNEWHSAMSTGKVIGLAALHKDYIYRAWNASHGGVYVPITDEIKPNPYLSHIPDRNISTVQGKNLTLMNPAYMTRQVHELGLDMYGLRGHLTSLNVIRSENKPDQWETRALQQFEKGTEKVEELVTMDNIPFMRIMIPMQTKEFCLKCHAEQGYKVGDIRGGISVMVSMQDVIANARKHILTSSLYHLLTFLIGVTILFVFYRQTNKQLGIRVEAEERLKIQGNYLQGIVDNISNGIAVYDAHEDGEDFIIKSINQAGLRIAQLELEDVAGKRVTEIFPGVIDLGLFAVFQRVWTTGEAEHLPAPVYNDARISQWVENYVYKLPTGEIVAVYNDITQRKQAEEHLLRKTEEWQKTFNAIPDIITLQDKNMRIVQANKAAHDLLAKKDETLIGKRCYEVFSGDSKPCAGCPGITTLHDNHSHSGIIVQKELKKTFQVSSTPILDQNKKVQYLVHVAQDITEQKRLEDELFQVQKMEAIGTLAGGIAHDFNNILSGVTGYAEMAKMDILSGEAPPVEYLDQVLIAGKRATELVKQILTFSRKTVLHTQPLSPYLIVKEALKMLRSSLPTSISIQQDIDSECGQVLADPTKIHQIVVNLCTNAMHAMEDEKGTLSVSLHRKKLQTEDLIGKDAAPGSFIVLSVSDTGHGMDQETMKRIFEPYFTTKEMDKGTGLGLAVIHGIIQEYKGFIAVESEPGKGTSFHVHIPALKKTNVGEAESTETDISLLTGSERILVVDDEEPIVSVIKTVLERFGYAVTATTDSLDALAEIRANPDQFDLVITDQTMPNMTGAELAQKILQIKPDMPIILCTGYSSVISKEDALAIGIKEYVKKPAGSATLAKTVRQVLDNN